jgi:hypothetical protein
MNVWEQLIRLLLPAPPNWKCSLLILQPRSFEFAPLKFLGMPKKPTHGCTDPPALEVRADV